MTREPREKLTYGSLIMFRSLESTGRLDVRKINEFWVLSSSLTRTTNHTEQLQVSKRPEHQDHVSDEDVVALKEK